MNHEQAVRQSRITSAEADKGAIDDARFASIFVRSFAAQLGR